MPPAVLYRGSQCTARRTIVSAHTLLVPSCCSYGTGKYPTYFLLFSMHVTSVYDKFSFGSVQNLYYRCSSSQLQQSIEQTLKRPRISYFWQRFFEMIECTIMRIQQQRVAPPIDDFIVYGQTFLSHESLRLVMVILIPSDYIDLFAHRLSNVLECSRQQHGSAINHAKSSLLKITTGF